MKSFSLIGGYQVSESLLPPVRGSSFLRNVDAHVPDSYGLYNITHKRNVNIYTVVKTETP